MPILRSTRPVNTLATGDRVRRGLPLCLIGDYRSGEGVPVKYTLATRLVNELVEAADEKTLARTMARYGRVDLLCIDELTEREEKNSVAIDSNESFSGWTKTIHRPRLCAAIVDRLTFNGTIIETGSQSYRMNHTRRQLTG